MLEPLDSWIFRVTYLRPLKETSSKEDTYQTPITKVWLYVKFTGFRLDRVKNGIQLLFSCVVLPGHGALDTHDATFHFPGMFIPT